MTEHALRPLARTVVRLDNEGMATAEIAWRLRRSPGHINRILEWTKLPRSRADHRDATAAGLRPIERRVLQARSDGVDRAEVAARLRRSPQHVARIEQYADAKLAGLT